MKSSAGPPSNSKDVYRSLKRKFKELITANEVLQEELKRRQKKLLRINQDKYFLMERLLAHEKPLLHLNKDGEEKLLLKKVSKESPDPIPEPAPPPMASFEETASTTFDFDSFPTAMPHELFDSDIKIEEECEEVPSFLLKQQS